MLVGRSTAAAAPGGVGGSGLGSVIGEVVDCHRAMATVHREQSAADALVAELAGDYGPMVQAAKEALGERRKAQMEVEQVRKGEKNKKSSFDFLKRLQSAAFSLTLLLMCA